MDQIETLPDTQNVFELRRRFLVSIAEGPCAAGDARPASGAGAFAAYMNRLAADFKSVAASGWGPELIPEEDILQSQFPEALEQIEKDQARIAELEGLFAAVDATEEGEEPEESEDGVLPKELVRSLKDERKATHWQGEGTKKVVKSIRQDIGRMEKAGYAAAKINEKRSEASDSEAEAVDLERQIEAIDNPSARHTELETELKTLKANIRQVERRRTKLVATARAKISDDEARQLIRGTIPWALDRAVLRVICGSTSGRSSPPSKTCGTNTP